MDSPDEKRKRFCVICNNFKPERTHHCSTCNQCVLVMDHHCPWLNNCVGFNNRKVFILLITYAFALTIIGLIFSPYPIVMFIVELIQGNHTHLVQFIFSAIGYIFIWVFVFIIWAFIKYHFSLIEANQTTIEQLDEKRGNISTVSYDMGHDFNWKFVLGANKAFWWLPIDTGIGAPMGDGVVISKKEVESAQGKPENDGEFDYNELDQGNNKDWNADDPKDPLNLHDHHLNAHNPLATPLSYKGNNANNQKNDFF